MAAYVGVGDIRTCSALRIKTVDFCNGMLRLMNLEGRGRGGKFCQLYSTVTVYLNEYAFLTHLPYGATLMNPPLNYFCTCFYAYLYTFAQISKLSLFRPQLFR